MSKPKFKVGDLVIIKANVVPEKLLRKWLEISPLGVGTIMEVEKIRTGKVYRYLVKWGEGKLMYFYSNEIELVKNETKKV